MPDIMQTGPVGLKGLKGVRQGFEKLAGESAESIATGNMPLAERPVGMELAQHGYGDSVYDQEATSMYDVENLDDFRGRAQSGIMQIGNGLIKMATTAATTFLDGTLGLLWGLGTGIANTFSDDPDTTFINGLWNNDFNRAMSDIQDKMEEIAPNYYTDLQRNSSWNTAANILSANFLGDKLLKNAGFTIGALAAASVPGFNMGWLGRGVAALGKGTQAAQKAGVFASRAAQTLVSANSEASIEAINAVKEGQKTAFANIEKLSLEAQQDAQMEYEDNLLNGMSQSEAQKIYQNRLLDIDKQAKLGKSEAEKQLRDIGNTVWGLNMGVLSVSNTLEFSRILKGGYKPQKMLNDFNVRKLVAGQETNDLREVGRAAVRGDLELVNDAINPASKRGIADMALRTGRNILSEGTEELVQNVISNTGKTQAQAKLQQWADDSYRSDREKYSLFANSIDPNITTDLIDYTKAAAKTWNDQFGSISSPGWEEFVLGGLTGALGTVGIKRNETGSVKLGWQGGWWDAMQETKQNYAETQAIVDSVNDMLGSDKFRQKARQAAVALAMTNDMDMAIQNGDVLKFKNAELGAIVNNALEFRNQGLLDAYKGMFEELSKNVSDDDIQQIKNQLKDVVDKESSLDLKTNDEIRAEVQDKAKSTLDKIDKTIEVYDDEMSTHYDAFAKESTLLAPAAIEDVTHLRTLYNDLLRRKAELEQERDAHVNDLNNKQYEQSIKEVDKEIAKVKEFYDNAVNNPKDYIEYLKGEIIKANKNQRAKDEKKTIEGYHMAEDLQGAADILFYSIANKGNQEAMNILNDAISKAEGKNKDLLKQLSPFIAQVQGVGEVVKKEANRLGLDENDLGKYIDAAISNVALRMSEKPEAFSLSQAINDIVDSFEGMPIRSQEDADYILVTSAALNNIATEVSKIKDVQDVKRPEPKKETKQREVPDITPDDLTGEKAAPEDLSNVEDISLGTEPSNKQVSEQPAANPKVMELPSDLSTISDFELQKLDDQYKAQTQSNSGLSFEDRNKAAANHGKIFSEQQRRKAAADTSSSTGDNLQNTEVTPNRKENKGKKAQTFAVGDKVLIPATTSDSTDSSISPLIKDGKIEATVTGVTKDGSVSVQYGNNNSVHADVRADKVIKQTLPESPSNTQLIEDTKKKIESLEAESKQLNEEAKNEELPVTATQKEAEAARKTAEAEAAKKQLEELENRNETLNEEEVAEERGNLGVDTGETKSLSFKGITYETYDEISKHNAELITTYKDQIDAFKNQMKSIFGERFDIESIVNNALGRLSQAFASDNGRIPIKYIQAKEAPEHIFLGVAMTAPVKKAVEDILKNMPDLSGHVINIDGREFFVAGLLYRGWDTNDSKNIEALRAQYKFIKDELDKAAKNSKGNFTVLENLKNFIYDMSGGDFVTSFGKDDTGDVNLKTLLDNPVRNPHGMKPSTIKWAVVEGQKEEPDSYHMKYINVSKGDRVLQLTDKHTGAVYMYIEAGDGRLIPTRITQQSWNDRSNFLNTESEYWKQLSNAIEALLAPDVALSDRVVAISKLRDFLQFRGEEGNLYLQTDQTKNDYNTLKAARKNGDTLEKHNEVIKFDENYDPAAAREILERMLDFVNPLFNLRVTELRKDPSFYLDAGLLRTNIKHLGVLRNTPYLYPVDKEGNPDMRSYTERNAENSYTSSKSKRVARNRYEYTLGNGRKAEFWYDGTNFYNYENGRPLTAPGTINQFSDYLKLWAGELPSVPVEGMEGASYYIGAPNRLYLVDKDGRITNLTPQRSQSVYDSISNQKHEERREDALREDKNNSVPNTEGVKYPIGFTFKSSKGGNLVVVNIVNLGDNKHNYNIIPEGGNPEDAKEVTEGSIDMTVAKYGSAPKTPDSATSELAKTEDKAVEALKNINSGMGKDSISREDADKLSKLTNLAGDLQRESLRAMDEENDEWFDKYNELCNSLGLSPDAPVTEVANKLQEQGKPNSVQDGLLSALNCGI